jgi:hypothetical protein
MTMPLLAHVVAAAAPLAGPRLWNASSHIASKRVNASGPERALRRTTKAIASQSERDVHRAVRTNEHTQQLPPRAANSVYVRTWSGSCNIASQRTQPLVPDVAERVNAAKREQEVQERTERLARLHLVALDRRASWNASPNIASKRCVGTRLDRVPRPAVERPIPVPHVGPMHHFHWNATTNVRSKAQPRAIHVDTRPLPLVRRVAVAHAAIPSMLALL